MKLQISYRDMKVLSAYLDGQLNSRKRARLEARLESEPDLRVALAELGRTRNLLRAVPRLRAPRNFTLTPEMVGGRRGVGARLYPTFQLASAIATLLFVAVVAGDFFGGSWQLATGLDQAAPQVAVLQEKGIAPQESMVEAPVAEMAAEMAEEMSMDAAEPEAFTLEAEIAAVPEGEPEDVANGVFLTVTLEAEEPVGAVIESMKVGEGEAAAGEEAPVLKEAPPQDEAVEGEAFESDEQVTMDRAIDREVDEGPSQDAWIEVAEDTVTADTTPQEPEPEMEAPGEIPEISRSRWSFLRVAEVLLGIIALGTGGLAFHFRRRK